MVAPTLARAQDVLPTSKAPVLLNADRVTYDQNGKTAVASGQVEISQGDHLLRADEVTYDQNRDVVTAQGHVAIVEPNGQVSFADHAEVTSDMKEGFVDQIRMLMVDNSRFAAQEGERVDGRYVILRRATYSACDLCKTDPTKAPLWQLRASKVTHDNESKRIIYRDAFLELGGIPVFYSPYFSHPDPSVKRKSGVLPPLVGSNGNVGTFATIPYYFDLAPDKDLTISPTFSTNDKFQFAAEYRQRFAHGNMKLNGSAMLGDRVNDQNVVETNKLRGHLFGDLLFDLGPEYRAGAKVAFTSDKNYLYRYHIPTNDTLENRGYLERFRRRNYFVTDLIFFQDLRPGDHQVEPLALRTQYSAVGAPGKTLGGRWDFNASAVSITRDSTEIAPATRGPDSKRGSAALGWERRLVSDTGLVTTMSGNVRGDIFWANRLQDPSDPNNFYTNVASHRVLPVGSMNVSYPIGRMGENWNQIITPIVAITGSPRQSTDPHTANEDSQGTEFDETNLFALNRFSGVDHYETGVRATYGLRAGAYNNAGNRIEAMFGESYRLTKDMDFSDSSGLQNRRSDYVGRLDFEPTSWIYANYGFRLSEVDLHPRRSEANVAIGESWFRPYGQYLSVDGVDSSNNPAVISEVTYGFTSQLTKYWSIAAHQTRALRLDPGPRSSAATLTYKDECATIGLTVNRDQTNRTDVSKGTSFVLSVYLRNLGGVNANGDAGFGSGSKSTTSNP